MKLLFLLVSLLLINNLVFPQSKSKYSLDGGLILSHFQQQVKQDVGDPRGERLVFEYEIGLLLTGRYELNDYFSAGIFIRTDIGKREAALFDGFDIEGKTKVKNQLGGNYTEVWFGPEVMFHWKQLFAEVGYGLVGIRSDEGRDDIPSNSGDTVGSFTTNPSISWLISIGGFVPLSDNLEILLKLEYRLRYYNKRGGEPLIDNIDLGTQSISPLIGVSWKF
jgi:hypothetical protein